ncbi:MAG: 4Fe-4S binding protein [Armatimonadota bacterium]
MGSIIKKTSNSITKKRIFTQIAALIILNLPFLQMHTICAPVFYCHSCPLSAFACPLGVLVNFSTLKIFPFVTLGILGLAGTLGGRFVCGWLCPFGFMQDMLYKIRTKKISITPKLYYIKYAILAVMVLAIPFFLPGKPYTFCNFCPSGTLESTIPWAIKGVTSGDWVNFGIRIAVLLGVILFAVVASRSWCRVLCPLGAIFAFFNKFSLLRFKLLHEKCNGCGVCSKCCPTEIDPVKDMNTAECIRCMDCTATKHIKLGTK